MNDNISESSRVVITRIDEDYAQVTSPDDKENNVEPLRVIVLSVREAQMTEKILKEMHSKR